MNREALLASGDQNPLRMRAEGHPLWERLRELPLGSTGVAFDFSARLAAENGWSHGFSRRVVEEYRRFLFLAMEAGGPVTPSVAVDQVWHLHLVYTRSYWDDLCGRVLGRPLHHDPTAGGLAERGKFFRQYDDTLSAYKGWFGEVPPTDIWPSAEVRFAPARNEWVDRSKHWVVQRPRRLLRLRTLAGIGAALVLPILLIGCTRLNVWDYEGAPFLIFYAQAFGVALFLTPLIQWGLRRRWAPVWGGEDGAEDPFELAFLAGGGRRVMDAAMAALYSRGLLSAERQGGRGVVGISPGAAERDSSDLHEMEERVMQALPLSGHALVGDVRKSLQPVVEEVRDRLVQRGWVFSERRWRAICWWRATPMMVLMGVGLVKVAVGLSRDKPVGFLVVSLFVSFILLGLASAFSTRRTVAGQALWKKMKAQKRRKRRQLQSEAAIDPAAAALLVALSGAGALTAPGFEPLHASIYRADAMTSGGCGSSGCGSSGCGAGGDGGSGSGCGGGGCGGCGGGD